MDRDGVMAFAMARTDWGYEPKVGKALAGRDEIQDEGPGLWDKLCCAFTCWWSGSHYEAVRLDGPARICVCSGEWRPGSMWQYR
ncbi:MAG TPA: hypothetical protein PLL10_00110 [Elusimicrobiales bacterium]|nr:hypothetical protein [Elusimicrobiales bacterium]